MKLFTVEPTEYLFGHRAVPIIPGPYVRGSIGPQGPFTKSHRARAVRGLAIAPQSEVRAVKVRVGGDWQELVEGQPLAVDPRAVPDNRLTLDQLDYHDGRLVIQIAEDACEIPALSKWVADFARLTIPNRSQFSCDEYAAIEVKWADGRILQAPRAAGRGTTSSNSRTVAVEAVTGELALGTSASIHVHCKAGLYLPNGEWSMDFSSIFNSSGTGVFVHTAVTAARQTIIIGTGHDSTVGGPWHAGRYRAAVVTYR